MSTQAVAWALDARQTGPMTAESRLVLVMLADYAGPDGRNAWPKKATIAARLGITRRSVQRALANLRAAGLIGEGDQRLVQHLDPRYRPTVYDLALNGVQIVARGEDFELSAEPYREDPHDDVPELSTPEPVRGDAPVTPDTSRGDSNGTSGETVASPYEPPLEPPLTHLVTKGDPRARETPRQPLTGERVTRLADTARAALANAKRPCDVCSTHPTSTPHPFARPGLCRTCAAVSVTA